VTCPPFRPYPLTAGGHRQTVLGFFARRRLVWPHPTEDIVVDAERDVRLLLRASWQPGPREERPALVLVHGLGGWDEAGYGLAAGRLAFATGWHVVRMNMRGAGHGVSYCPRLYHAGLDGDLVAVLRAVAGSTPRLALLGFSLGANVGLLALGRLGERVPAGLGAMVAVCPPLDLEACAEALDRPANRLYQAYFVRKLREGYRLRQRLAPHLFEAGREAGIATVREFDEKITAPYGGFGSAAEYYAASSAGPWLERIDRRVLLLAAGDDPLIPADSVRRFSRPASGLVELEVAPTGGHVGFVGPARAPGSFWAGDRALSFLNGGPPWATPGNA
jgi:predicted alpha/beta-fold hydrolase